MGLRDIRRKQAKAIREASPPNPEFQREMDLLLLIVFSLPAFGIAIGFFATLPETLDWAKTHSQEFHARMAVAMPFAAIIVGWLMYQLRERRKKLYAFLELGAAAGTAYSAWSNAGTVDSFTTAIALSAALYVSVRGFDNLNKAREEEEKANKEDNKSKE